MICDDTADFLDIPEEVPRGGIRGVCAIARNIGCRQRRGTSIPILCSAAPASAGAASVVSTRSVPVVVAVAATVGSVACVVLALEFAVHVAF